MKTIYKYALNRHTTKIKIPKGWEFVSLGYDPSNVLCIWALIDKDNPEVEEYFSVVGTGWDIEENGVALGSIRDGEFMWHVLLH